MKLKIYRGLNVFAEPSIDLQTEFNEVLMGVDEIVSNITSPTPLLLEIDDYVIFRNENYFIDSIPEYNKINEETHQYSIKFLHPKFRLNADFISHLGDTTFTYFGDATAFLTLLLSCIHTLDTAYQLGEIEPTEQIFISFDGNTYLQALGIIAEAFNLEYKVRGKVIDLKKQIGTDTNLTFEYGRGKGLYSLTRKAINDENVVNKVYGFGSSQNIDYTYRNGAKRLTFEGGFLTAVTPYGLRAGIYTNDNIKPERTAPVTGIEPIEGNGFAIYDTSLDFDIRDYFQEGTVPKVIFKTGELAGGDQEFEITGYNHVTKKISLSLFKGNDGYVVPNSTFMVAVGDQFSFIDMNQPESYVADAESRLQVETQAYLDENKIPKVAYDLPIDPKYIRTTGASLRVGDLVTVIDARHGVNHKLRIVGIRVSLADLNQVKVTIANFVPYTFEERVIASAINNQKEIKEVVRGWKESLKRSAINLRVLQDSIFDTDGLFDTDKINVGVLSAALGIFGVKSQNLSLSGVVFKPNYGGNANSFQVTNGKLIHHEIEIAGGGNVWVVDGVTATSLVGNSLYYVYAKCSRTTLTGEFVVTTDQIGVEDVVGQYHFLVGVLYPVNDGYRDYDNTYGITTITGRTIEGGIIKSRNGGLEINLETGEVKGTITVLGGNAATNESVDNKIDGIEVGGRNYFLNSAATRTLVLTTSPLSIQNGNFPVPKEMSVSFYARVISGAGRILHTEFNGGNRGTNFTISTDFQRYTTVMSTVNSPIWWLWMTDAPATIEIKEVMITIGNKPMDWSPAPEDVEEDTQAKADHAEQAAILAAAMDATDKVNAIEVGGRNYALGTDIYFYEKGEDLGKFNYSFESDFQQLRGKTLISSVYVDVQNVTETGYLMFEPVISYDDGSYSAITARKYFDYLGDSFRGVVSSEPVVILDKPITGLIQRSIWIRVNASSMKVGRPKLEVGNKPTDWSPAPEDIRTDLRLTAPLPSVITLNEDGVTARLTSDPNRYARLNGQGLVVVGGAVDIRTHETNGIGVQINANGITGYDNLGVLSFNLNAATGEMITRKGSIGGLLIEANSIKSSNNLFSVTSAGFLIAQTAHITGTIYATGGSISGNLIIGGTLNGNNVSITNLNASNITSGAINASLITTGTINASLITAGTLNGNFVNITNLNASNITSGTINANNVNIINLVANNIRTAGSGQRVEILQASNDFKMYDNNNTLLIKMDPISGAFGEPGIGVYNSAGEKTLTSGRGIRLEKTGYAMGTEIRFDRAFFNGSIMLMDEPGGQASSISMYIGGVNYSTFNGTVQQAYSQNKRVVNGIIVN